MEKAEKTTGGAAENAMSGGAEQIPNDGAAPRPEMIGTDALRPYGRNTRTHSARQIEQIAASIREFGFVNPVLVDDENGIIAGHGRWAAAQKLGLAAVPCLRVSHLTDVQRRAYIIADNKLAENAGWDDELLRLELGALWSEGVDIDGLGFSRDEADGLLAGLDVGGGLADADELPPAESIHPRAAAGDIWCLGAHRVACGDSTDQEIVGRLLAGAAPHLMVTDPPYGTNYDPTWRGGGAQKKVFNDNNADWRAAWALFPGDVGYVWAAGLNIAAVQCSLEACRFEVLALITWAKSQLVISRGHYHFQSEHCFYVRKKGKHCHWRGSRKRSTVWRGIEDVLRVGEDVFVRRSDAGVLAISSDESVLWEIPKPEKNDTGHSAQKPVECMRRPMRNNSKRGDLVYDPFLGSGTTVIAAEEIGRVCYGVELSPEYVDIIISRWEKFTGKAAERLNG